MRYISFAREISYFFNRLRLLSVTGERTLSSERNGKKRIQQHYKTEGTNNRLVHLQLSQEKERATKSNCSWMERWPTSELLRNIWQKIPGESSSARLLHIAGFTTITYTDLFSLQMNAALAGTPHPQLSREFFSTSLSFQSLQQRLYHESQKII